MTESTATVTAADLREQWYQSEVSVPPISYWSVVRHRFIRNKLGVAALVVLILIVAGAIFAPWLSPYDPLIGKPADRLENIFSFSSGHPLGTDEQGRDMLTRALYGGRLSLLAGFVPTLVAAAVGTIIGTWAGLVRGAVGAILMRVMDMLYAFPAILLAIAVGASLGPGLTNTIIAVSIVFIPPVSRIAESETRKIVTSEYVEAARLSGASRMRILRTQLLPNVLNEIIVYSSGLVGVAMIIAASLSFLGLGSRPPTPEWGYMLESLQGDIYVVPAVVAIPGLFIFLASVTFNTASDALREAMDTRLS
ncbi:MAG TPA: ABC transporter permease [Mycobacteriales bacterium]|jgi:peptide/nickel transport system permease protein|nr:ABC transporter permease [Mycobacteriales bacterium]